MSIHDHISNVKPTEDHMVCPNGCVDKGGHRGRASQWLNGNIYCHACGKTWTGSNHSNGHDNPVTATFDERHLPRFNYELNRMFKEAMPGDYIIIRKLASARNKLFISSQGYTYYGKLSVKSLCLLSGWSVAKVRPHGLDYRLEVAFKTRGKKRSLHNELTVPLLTSYGSTADAVLGGNGSRPSSSYYLPRYMEKAWEIYCENPTRKNANACADASWLITNRTGREYSRPGYPQERVSKKNAAFKIAYEIFCSIHSTWLGPVIEGDPVEQLLISLQR